ncbi:hypothetical protein FA09DRAFT_79902 [Tilletiopsis washingtonensis]|jgi:hypothetical protein|uniref:Uncharacterized protein n=1 Tax=Tilletiopsis washingtonensis TaxID=58919 RepID=A0A316Z6E6_9BASI|nr:hypothetical protein FA09DRAFT_79902 [Tilletiopsis washingtonensis]PWN96624.1 hypothetical protein FA09DRAFT_79902 [Tilletiopsis washingtonensis]
MCSRLKVALARRRRGSETTLLAGAPEHARWCGACSARAAVSPLPSALVRVAASSLLLQSVQSRRIGTQTERRQPVSWSASTQLHHAILGEEAGHCIVLVAKGREKPAATSRVPLCSGAGIGTPLLLARADPLTHPHMPQVAVVPPQAAARSTRARCLRCSTRPRARLESRRQLAAAPAPQSHLPMARLECDRQSVRWCKSDD